MPSHQGHGDVLAAAPGILPWLLITEWMNYAVMIFAAVATVLMLLRDSVAAFQSPAEWAVHTYRIYADVWLVGILPVTLYPFLGGGAATGARSRS